VTFGGWLFVGRRSLPALVPFLSSWLLRMAVFVPFYVRTCRCSVVAAVLVNRVGEQWWWESLMLSKHRNKSRVTSNAL